MASRQATAALASAPTVPTRGGRMVWITGLLLLALIIGVVLHLSQGRQFAALLRQARPLWLLAALGLQVGTYVCAAGVWQRALACQGIRDSLRHLMSLGIAKTFMDQAVPSAGLSGTMLVARSLRHRGVPNRNAVATVLAGLVAFYLSYGAAVGVALVILWSTGRVSKYVTSGATLFALIMAIIPATILWLTRRRRRVRLPRWLMRMGSVRNLVAALADRPAGVIRSPRFLAEATALQLGIILLDALTLAVLLSAVGGHTSLRGAFAAFTVGSMVGTISPIPGGLGTFDGTVIAMLRAFQVPLEPALAATVLLRGFTFILPLLPGFWLTRKEAAAIARAERQEAARRTG